MYYMFDPTQNIVIDIKIGRNVLEKLVENDKICMNLNKY